MAGKIGRRESERVWQKLLELKGEGSFDPESVEGLPEPARRYLRHAIAPGTPLARSVELEIEGSIRIDRTMPPVPLRARQLLAPPQGFVWRARLARGLRKTTGFDLYAEGAAASQWRLWGLVPAEAAEGPDVTRSAAGRLAIESIWLPTALLPERGVAWEAADERTALARVAVGGERVQLAFSIDAGGRLERASTMRWRVSGPGGAPGRELFVIDQCSNERSFDGLTVPTSVRAGWRLGASDEEPFYLPSIRSAVYR